MITTTNDANLRAAARRRGFVLEKRRGGYCSELFDGYMVRDSFCGAIVAGERYQLSAKDVRDFLNEKDMEK